MNITIESNIKSVLKEFDQMLSKDIPYAIKDALNDTMFELRKEMPAEIERVFDKPTVFTKSVNAWEVEKANMQSLVGVIKLKPAQNDYLKWQVYGGTETPRKRAIPMPELKGKGKLVSSTHGGLQKGWKKVFGDKQKYFSGVPKGAKEGGKMLPIVGVYERVSKTKWDKKKKRHSGKIMLLLTWEDKLEYNKKWDFHYFASTEFDKRFSINFRTRVQKAVDYRASKAGK